MMVLIEMIKLSSLVPELGIISVGDKKNDPCQNTKKQEPFPLCPEGYPHRRGSFNLKANLLCFNNIKTYGSKERKKKTAF
jgi:hypothetical protein